MDILAFIVWSLLGVAFILLGLYCIFTKKEVPCGFWANAKTFPVENVRAYNRAVGKLWIIFGLGFLILGLPLLGPKGSPGIVFSILGIPAESIAAMAVYTMVIEKKYRKK